MYVRTKYSFVKADYVYNNYTSTYPSIILTTYPSFHILMQYNYTLDLLLIL